MFWDVFGEPGTGALATVSDMGQCCWLACSTSTTQAGVLRLVFKIADDQGLLIIGPGKDLQRHPAYWQGLPPPGASSISAASIGAIQRGLLAIETGAVTKFFDDRARHRRP